MSEIKFSQPQEYIVTSTQQNNLFLAGVGSGKTHLAGFISGYLLTNFPHVTGFIGANTYNQLTTSTLYRTREVWSELFGWEEGKDYVINRKPPMTFNTERHNFDDYNGIMSFKWGAIAFKGSLDNAKAHDGKEFGWAILDETKDSREEDVKETILTRLRAVGIYIGPDGQLTDKEFTEEHENVPFNPLYILTSPAKVRWINEWFKLDDYQHEILGKIFDHDDFFVKDFSNKCVVISSTYHNEENLPKNYIQRQIDDNTEEGAKKLIYGNPFVKAGGEFYSGFDRTKHVRKCPYKPGLPIHISFDQNVVPYITATLYQIEDIEVEGKMIKEVTQFDEMCLKNPNNKTAKLCIEFIKRWGRYKDGLYIYGDPSGRKSDTRGLEHDYKIIKRLLRPYLNNRSDRVPYKHPPIIKRGEFINEIFEGVHPIRFFVDPKCKNSISDFDFVKEDPNGKKLKERYKDPNTGQTYEKYGHTSDAFDYFICKAFERLFAKKNK